MTRTLNNPRWIFITFGLNQARWHFHISTCIPYFYRAVWLATSSFQFLDHSQFLVAKTRNQLCQIEGEFIREYCVAHRTSGKAAKLSLWWGSQEEYFSTPEKGHSDVHRLMGPWAPPALLHGCPRTLIILPSLTWRHTREFVTTSSHTITHTWLRSGDRESNYLALQFL